MGEANMWPKEPKTYQQVRGSGFQDLSISTVVSPSAVSASTFSVPSVVIPSSHCTISDANTATGRNTKLPGPLLAFLLINYK